jgi:hypothetical protein
MKRPVKSMERVPYGPKTNGNLIRCHLQVFGKNPIGLRNLTRVLKIVCYSSQKWPETDVFLKSYNSKLCGPETYPGGSMP